MENDQKNIKKEEQNENDKIEHFERFIKIVPSDSDPVAMILRCHLLIEYYLDRVIMMQIPRGDIITESRLHFSEKLIIVEALDIIKKNLLDGIKKINSVRNACSHVLNYLILETDIDRMGSPLGSKYFEIKKKSGSDLKVLLHTALLITMARFTAEVQNIEDIKFKKK